MKSPRAYLVEQVSVNIVINFIIAYFIAKTTLAALQVIPMQAPHGDPLAPNMAGDLLVGSFLAGLIITLLLSKITHWNVRNSKVDKTGFELTGWIRLLPQSTFKRSLLVGVFAALILAMPVIIIMNMLGIHQAATGDYILIHAVYAAIIGGALAYIASKRALADSQ